MLNQNAKLDRCAHRGGAITEVVHLLVDSGVGLLQLPCPELVCLGLDRSADPDGNASIEDEDTRIAARMAQPDALATCRDLAQAVVRQVCNYHRHGFEVIGLVGINGSPTCGVETTWYDDRERPGPGVFVAMLRADLDEHTIALPMRGIKAYRPEGSIQVVKQMLPGGRLPKS